MIRGVTVALALATATTARAGVLVGGELALSPGGSLTGQASGQPVSVDTSSSIGFAGQLGYRAPAISVALAVRYLPHTEIAVERMSAYHQLDAGARLTGHLALAPAVELLGFVEPAYSVIYDDHGGAHGLVVSFGGGVGYAVADHVMVAATLGYAYGDQHSADGGLAATRLPLVGLAISTR